MRVGVHGEVHGGVERGEQDVCGQAADGAAGWWWWFLEAEERGDGEEERVVVDGGGMGRVYVGECEASLRTKVSVILDG